MSTLQSGPSSRGVRLYIGFIPYEWNIQDLMELLHPFGHPFNISIIRNRRGSMGYGFASMRDRAAALKAIQALDGVLIKNRKIQVNFAALRNLRPTGESTSQTSASQRESHRRSPWWSVSKTSGMESIQHLKAGPHPPCTVCAPLVICADSTAPAVLPPNNYIVHNNSNRINNTNDDSDNSSSSSSHDSLATGLASLLSSVLGYSIDAPKCGDEAPVSQQADIWNAKFDQLPTSPRGVPDGSVDWRWRDPPLTGYTVTFNIAGHRDNAEGAEDADNSRQQQRAWMNARY